MECLKESVAKWVNVPSTLLDCTFMLYKAQVFVSFQTYGFKVMESINYIYNA